MPKWSLSLDPRYFQVIFQTFFLLYGIFILHWEPDTGHYIASIGGTLFFQFILESIRTKKWVRLKDFQRWGFSGLISAMSLCLLLKTNTVWISLLAAFLTVSSKFIFRYKGKHLFNPSAFGIVAVLLLTEGAWLSPGQWGTGTVLLFAVLSLGFIVVTRVQKLDISLAFLISFGGLLFWRQVVYLEWPADFFLHSISTGSLLLFTFFMISDPRTSPNHPVARIIWACIIAFVAFYLSAFQWKYNTPIWVLVVAGPLVPMLDHLFKAKDFEWKNTKLSFRILSTIKSIVMIRFSKKTAALLLLLAMTGQEAAAFCGFYVSKADGTLKNKTSQVILVRDGNKTVITMSNDFKGNVRDFAMVVPVPVVLAKSDIKVVDAGIFQRLNDYSKPRLVEYYDANPCQQPVLYESLSGSVNGVTVKSVPMSRKKDEDKEYNVKVEATYTVGEYDIVILSAEESGGLKRWLDDNGYKIPKGAEEVLDPYIKSNLKFFVVKVNLEEKSKTGSQQLRPLQIKFESPKFMLPIRLGMANADGDQDMIVYAFTRNGRVETTNYRTLSLPTSKNIPLFVKENFGNFYSNLFEHQINKEGRSALYLEYAWDVSPSNYVKCDPCVSDPPQWNDLREAGVWWMDRDSREDRVSPDQSANAKVFFTRLHVRYNRKSFPQDLVFQTTPNTENFQARYIVTHPATGEMDCEAGKAYLRSLKERRQNEMEMLTYLTGKDYNDWDQVGMTEEEGVDASAQYATLQDNQKTEQSSPLPGLIFGTVALAGLAMLGYRKI